MGCLRRAAISLLGLILLFGAGYGGYALGHYVGYAWGHYEGYNEGYEQGGSEGQASGYSEGYEDGYEIGYQEGAGSGYTLRNPIYSELMRFLADDRTDSNEYVEGVYVCYDFAADVNNNAEAKGIRTAFVYIEYLDGAHAIVAFETVDRGLIFIEPQFDDEVQISLGTSYSQANGYLEPAHNDTITKFVVVW